MTEIVASKTSHSLKTSTEIFVHAYRTLCTPRHLVTCMHNYTKRPKCYYTQSK